ncbi:16S rRNA (guanine(966)-N(2))-methyltransferase RsmD [Nocardioides sp. GY 10127]|uniref:16S rRNA (guanine(966)-N(2))-methyltransferase RsmD n=1 Tax=Nocardioides sp. GY 10127 TaxID=2569762 RepID=UPI0010A8028B|nr:16S rRNA (guanine(966)-N(2))-methyltransferase RsmD [Nocardioides sp. GY 10127]TIC80827.1 16S rRNA (guanine(966)-N(2))-methyltransferase RsmD [Nocardioides sp. GY 10127]
MTRIIAGRAGGRSLATPRGSATRPTSDRVREALFSAVQAWAGSFDGLRVLDLYAGTGALGLEALSRGAAAATLVEHDKRTAALVVRNSRDLGLGPARVVSGTVRTFLAGPPPAEPFDLVLSDPPYPLADDAVAADLAALAVPGWLADDALVVVERSARSASPTWPEGFAPRRARTYGETALWAADWPGAGQAAGEAAAEAAVEGEQ